MERKDRRRYSRFDIDLPLDYQEVNNPHVRGGIVMNASVGGLLLESVGHLPVGTKLEITVFFPKGFELASFKMRADIVWQGAYSTEDWDGFRYGLNITQMLKEDHWILKLLLSGMDVLEWGPWKRN